MPIPNALIMTPIRFAATSYVIRVSANSVTTDLPFPASGSLTVGRDYWVSGDGQSDVVGTEGSGAGDLCAMLATAINAHTEISGATVTINGSWRVYINFNGATFPQIHWNHANNTLEGEIFGFDSTQSWNLISTNQTSSWQPRGLCRLQRPAKMDGRNRRQHVAVITRAVSGRSRMAYFGQRQRERDLEFGLLDRAVALEEYSAATEPYGSLEWNWSNSMILGRRFRFYDDESTIATPTAYELYSLREAKDEMMRDDQHAFRWKTRLPLILEHAP